MKNVLVTGLTLLFISACGGSGDGNTSGTTANKTPEWLEQKTESTYRYIYQGILHIDGEMYVPEQIPVDQPMTVEDANLYEFRTPKSNNQIGYIKYTWLNEDRDERSFRWTRNQFVAEFSESLRSVRRHLVVSFVQDEVHFFASEHSFAAPEIECILVEVGESTCDAYGQFYTFQNLDYPRIDGSALQEVDYTVILEGYLLSQMGIQ